MTPLGSKTDCEMLLPDTDNDYHAKMYQDIPGRFSSKHRSDKL